VKEYLLLVVIALVIALPAGWIIVGNLLKQFASRIEMNILIFIAIAAGSLIVALFTVSFQAFKASSINPATALKIE
jgi:ABC-type antimicrobial peptide transport system permease subunit